MVVALVSPTLRKSRLRSYAAARPNRRGVLFLASSCVVLALSLRAALPQGFTSSLGAASTRPRSHASSSLAARQGTQISRAALPSGREGPYGSESLSNADANRPVAGGLLSHLQSMGLALLMLFSSAPSAVAEVSLPFGGPATAIEQSLGADEARTVSLFERSTPSVVFITNEVYKIEVAEEQAMLKETPQGTGSGWVYDKEGHIVTNFHVIQNANSLRVRFDDGTDVPATVVGADPGSDVAVLQVNLPRNKDGILKPLPRGSSTAAKVGQDVYAIGNPFGLDHTLTKGIISGTGRTIMSVAGRPIQGAIQTDASINPGNSGGPLLNSRGQLIGMNTVIFSPSGASAGVGFAIPSDTVDARVKSILKFGYVKRPSLGIYLSPEGVATRLVGKEGSVVGALQRQSAAAAAGVQSGDVITEIDGRKVKKNNDVFAALDEHEPGETISLKVLRSQDVNAALDGQRVPVDALAFSVKLAEAPSKM